VTPALKNRGQANTLSAAGDSVDAKCSLSVQFSTAPLVTAGCASGAGYCPRQSLTILIWVIIAIFFNQMGL